jgi:hypothetical protein
MASPSLPLVELCADATAPAGEVREVSAVGHGLVSVRQVARLSAFTSLRSLVLHGGPLASLDGLAAVSATLEELNLSGNALEVVTGLGALPQLRVLNLVRSLFVRFAFALGVPRARVAVCGDVRARALPARMRAARWAWGATSRARRAGAHAGSHASAHAPAVKRTDGMRTRAAHARARCRPPLPRAHAHVMPRLHVSHYTPPLPPRRATVCACCPVWTVCPALRACALRTTS